MKTSQKEKKRTELFYAEKQGHSKEWIFPTLFFLFSFCFSFT